MMTILWSLVVAFLAYSFKFGVDAVQVLGFIFSIFMLYFSVKTSSFFRDVRYIIGDYFNGRNY